jgi:exo-beta-1,3-glucanase (GH17 family)
MLALFLKPYSLQHSTKVIMKPPPLTRTACRISGLLLLSFAVFSCRTSDDRQDAILDSGATPIQQRPGDLLCGRSRAVCYSGFRTGQRPGNDDPAMNPGDMELLEDLRILSRNGEFGLIRVYDSKATSANALRVIRDQKLNVKVLLGAWLGAEVSNTNCTWQKVPLPAEQLDANRSSNLQEVDRAIRLARQYPDIVAAVSVGNEALVDWNDHLVSVDSVIGYVRRVKRSISQPVTVAENCHWWAQHGARLAKEVDFVSIHTYAQWEGKDIEEAMAFTIANVQEVRNALPHSPLAITEAGWSTVATEFGGRASEKNQKRYFAELYAWAKNMNITTFFFEAFDEDWKGDANNPLGAEKHWGLYTVDRKPKLAMRELHAD